MLKIAVINGLIVHHDGISIGVTEMVRALNAQWPSSTHFFGYRCDEADIAHTIVNGIGELICDPKFVEADVVILHFGIYYELFNALLLCRGKKVAIVYHNITPKALLDVKHHSTIDRSFDQLWNIDFADQWWGDSPFNLRDLEALGLAPRPAIVLGLPVPGLSIERWGRSKKGARPELLYVGRFVRSKGVLELVKAVGSAKKRGCKPFHLSLAGGLHFSDDDYVNSIRQQLVDDDLENWVTFVGGVSTEQKMEMLEAAHLFVLPSFHEGYCIPIVEALSAGCAVIATSTAAIPETANGLALLVDPGDVAALSDAISNFIGDWYIHCKDYGEMPIRCERGVIPYESFRVTARRYANSCNLTEYRQRVCELTEALVKTK